MLVYIIKVQHMNSYVQAYLSFVILSDVERQ